MQQAQKVFREYINRNALKFTPQRRLILEVFLKQPGHLSTEDLYASVKAVDPAVGQATVYRTLKLLCDSGLAKEVHFGDGMARYETLYGHEHHDHLICVSCGKKVEVVDADIEELQEQLARKYGFLLTSHHMYLYGVCAGCRSRE